MCRRIKLRFNQDMVCPKCGRKTIFGALEGGE